MWPPKCSTTCTSSDGLPTPPLLDAVAQTAPPGFSSCCSEGRSAGDRKQSRDSAASSSSRTCERCSIATKPPICAASAGGGGRPAHHGGRPRLPGYPSIGSSSSSSSDGTTSNSSEGEATCGEHGVPVDGVQGSNLLLLLSLPLPFPLLSGRCGRVHVPAAASGAAGLEARVAMSWKAGCNPAGAAAAREAAEGTTAACRRCAR